MSKILIKEVADVTFYQINKQGDPTIPVLYLDTLKVSTVEQTAENTSARGGKGNAELVSWDYGKSITVTLEDALFSAKSLAIMYGAVDKDGNIKLNTPEKVRRTITPDMVTGDNHEYFIYNNATYAIPAGTIYYDAAGNKVNTQKYDDTTTEEINELNWAYATFEIAAIKDATSEIEISAATFPGTYYVTGDTFARAETDGKDEYLQLIFPKAKIESSVTLTLQADGDPTTFSMNLRVLRPQNGKMMKLVKYDLTPAS